MSNQNNCSNETAPNERVAFAIDIKEHEKFEHISDTKFISSNDFCSIVSQVFSVYEDFEGCSFEPVSGTNYHMIALYFNHRLVNVNPEGHTLAITKEEASANVKNQTLRSTRNFTNRYYNGDKFYLTGDGKDGLKPFLFDSSAVRTIYNQNWDVNWSKVVTEAAETNYIGGPQQQYTKVSFIDPAKLATAIFGEKDEDGTKWVYGVRILRSLPSISIGTNGNVNNNFMLSIDRVCESEVTKLAQMFGLGVSSGLNIIR